MPSTPAKLPAVSEVESCKSRLMYNVILKNTRNDRNILVMAHRSFVVRHRSENNVHILHEKEI